MKTLDFFTRLILIPGIFLYILSFIPEAVKDVKEWKQLFAQEGSKAKKAKKKTVQNTGATVYANSLSYPKLKPSFNNVILSQK